MHPASGKPESTEQDPDTLLRLLDLELKQKRVQWKEAAQRQRSSRLMSVMALVIIVVGVAVALFFVFSQANHERQQTSQLPASDRADR